jgi:hypothetical protein
MQQKVNKDTQSTSPSVPISGTDYVMKFGRWPKTTAGALTISFGHEFAAPPFVTISPFWNGSSGAVGSIDTITNIQPDEFTVTSQNAASNFFIDWIAIGKA